MKRRIVTPAQRQLEDQLITEWLKTHEPTRPAASVGMIDELEAVRRQVSRGKKRKRPGRLTE